MDGNPYSQWKCPHNYIPDWLNLQENRLEEAADLCHETNAFQKYVEGFVQEKLCEELVP